MKTFVVIYVLGPKAPYATTIVLGPNRSFITTIASSSKEIMYYYYYCGLEKCFLPIPYSSLLRNGSPFFSWGLPNVVTPILCSERPFVVTSSNGTQEIFNELGFNDFWN
jgi:hypothetical protein